MSCPLEYHNSDSNQLDEKTSFYDPNSLNIPIRPFSQLLRD